MKTITLKVDDSVFDKFHSLISQFSKNDITIVNEIDTTILNVKDFDYISNEELESLKDISKSFKSGNKEDFKEYIP